VNSFAPYNDENHIRRRGGRASDPPTIRLRTSIAGRPSYRSRRTRRPRTTKVDDR